MSKKLAAIGLIALVAAVGAVGSATALSGHSAVAKAKLQVRKGKLGRFITDARGLTLYLFEKDHNGKSACYGKCAKVWSPYLTSGKPTAGSGVSGAKVGVTKRTNGSMQVTYGGHPLYHYDDDHKPGQTKGQGLKLFGAEWYVLAPSGKKIDKS
jgi:predicted lipoprotein with Yx(FWY)xxD motif